MVRFACFVLYFASLALPVYAQAVFDDFSDGDFTRDPAWTGDTERFVVVPFGEGSALRSNGLARPDTLHLATASGVAFGRWRFLFRHEANLSTANGVRVYLVASTSDLKAPLEGYYVQFGTNNLNRIELWRQDGPAPQRTRLAVSEPLLAGDANTVRVEVTRDPAGRWRLFADGEAVAPPVTDLTHTESAALGVWLKHSTATGDRFFWTDLLADPEPGDLTPPSPLSAVALDGGASLRVRFDEPLDPATISLEAFSVSGAGGPTSASPAEDPSEVLLRFDPPLAEGDYTLTVSGVADPAGNVQTGAALPFRVELDETPPELVSAEALSETEVRVTFSEPVAGCEASLYEVSPGIGEPVSVACPTPEAHTLTLGQPLAGPALYTVTARGLTDLAGNVRPETSAAFFFGAFDVPGPRDLVINEVMYDPPDLHSNEYVEVYNRSSGTFDLSRLRLANATSPPRAITEASVPVPPGAYVVLARNPSAFVERYPGVPFYPVPGFPALVNSGDTVRLLLDDGTEIDAVPYRRAWGGVDVALERRDPEGPSAHPSNWADSSDPLGGTPGARNSRYEPDTTPPAPLAVVAANDGLTLRVRFSEPLAEASVRPEAFEVSGGPPVVGATYAVASEPSVTLALGAPLAPGPHTLVVSGVTDLAGNAASSASVAFEYDPDLDPPVVLEVLPLDAVTLRVRFDEPLDPASAEGPAYYAVSGGVGAPELAEVVAPAEVRLTLAVPLSGPRVYALSVEGVADVHGNAMPSQNVAFFYGEPEPAGPGDVVVNEVMYAPADLASNEWVEVLNVAEHVVDLGAFTLGDQTREVPVSAEPFLLPPGAYAVLVRNPSAFEAAFPEVPYLAVPGFPTLLNSADAVVLRSGGVTVDSVFYRSAWGGQGASLERRSPEGPSHTPSNWGTSPHPAGGTPGAPNALPPDTDPPALLAVDVAPDGRALAVTFDEPLDPASVTPEAFALDRGTVQAAGYAEAPEPTVTLALAAPLPEGAHTLTVSGVSDLLGNAIEASEVSFEYVPDTTPPALASVFAADPSTVRVRFSEPVTAASASEPSAYALSEGSVRAVTFAPASRADEVDLLLAGPLAEGAVHTLTVSGIEDPAGNVLASAQASFYVGAPAAPRPGDVAIHEVMFREAEGGTEYVELRNLTDRAFDLSRFTLSDRGAPRAVAEAPVLLGPGAYLAVARDVAALRLHFGPEGAALEMPRLPSLNNSGDAVVLRYGEAVIDSVAYLPSWHRPELRDALGVALERLDPHLSPNAPDNWTSSLDPRGGTPGLPNSAALPPGEAPPSAGVAASPSPFNGDVGTVIRYTLAAEAALVRVRVFDGAGRPVRTLEEATLAGAARTGEAVWNGRDDRGRPLRMGIYVVLVEAVDLAGGRTEVHRAPVVLAREL
jgi:hypothetical protein